MKRIITLLTAALLALSVPCAGVAAPMDGNHLIVGNPTPMRGEFFTDMWGNDTSDIDVRDLLHGCNLVMWDATIEMFKEDPSVVTDYTVDVNAAGDHVYTICLADDLCFSDGTEITAWDYAFSWLFCISPVISEIGGTPLRVEHIAGYRDYMDGVTPYLSGVKVPDSYTLQVTLDHEYLPFFYEMGLLTCKPYPIRVIAPGVVVKDDGDGVYLANRDPNIKELLFTAELLRKTVTDPEKGYQSHPSVVSGPYVLESWDGVTAEFKINIFYKGNPEGFFPIIDRLTYTTAVNGTMIEKLAAGEFGLLNKVTREDSIRSGIALTEKGGFGKTAYPRIGLSFFSFACEKDTVSGQAVRQAIAWCMDRDKITEDYVGEYGESVDGWYGIGQWMFAVAAGRMAPPVKEPEDKDDAAAVAAYEEAIAPYKALNLDALTHYTANTKKAAALLDQDGWTLNDDGLREKDGTVLDLKMVYPEGNRINEILQVRLIPNLEKVGIRLTMEALPMAELLTRWYRQGEREEDIFYLATNFDLVFDPSVHFLIDEEGKHNWSYTALNDEELYLAAVAMRETEPGDALTYLQRWIAFQERFNEVLPVLPVYSNYYYDFYTANLVDYFIERYPNWGLAIVQAYLE